MDLSFNKVSYDKDLAEFSEDELRKLVGTFEEAQESNVAEFEQAVEATSDVDENTIEDFEQAREALIEDIVEAETFDEVPLTEEALTDCEFAELREWEDFVLDRESEETEQGTFDNMGRKAPVEDDEETDFAEDVLKDVPGLEVQ